MRHLVRGRNVQGQLVQGIEFYVFDLMANLSIEVCPERVTAEGRRQEITRVFGPLRALERRWLRAY